MGGAHQVKVRLTIRANHPSTKVDHLIIILLEQHPDDNHQVSGDFLLV